jgi:hypothetical protein
MRDPSGDQLGRSSSPLVVVSRTCPLPSAFITQMSRALEPLKRDHAMRFPSGDQAGSSSNSLFFVSRTGSVPSAFMTQISSLDSPISLAFCERVETNAIRVPSGDHAGSLSSNGESVSLTIFEPVAPIT